MPRIPLKTAVREARLHALKQARDTVRADILLEPELTTPQLLDRITRSIDKLIEETPKP